MSAGRMATILVCLRISVRKYEIRKGPFIKIPKGGKMKMTDFEMFVEIPVRVFCSFHRADPSSGFYQGHPAYTQIDEIQLPPDTRGYIEKKYRAEILKAAEENKEC